MRVVSLLLVTLLLASANVAKACTIAMPPISETALDVATRGMLIRGTLIQALDLDRQKPEIIRIEQIYVGDGGPRDVKIFRPKVYFETEVRLRNARKDPNNIASAMPSCSLQSNYKVGHVFDRLVLMPIAARYASLADGAWSFSMAGGNVVAHRGLEMLLEQAQKLGRFQARPPKRADFGDCMECGSRLDR